MFLQEWFEFPQDSYWSKDKLRKRPRGILQRIKNSIKKRHPQFLGSRVQTLQFQPRNTVLIGFLGFKLSTLIDNVREVGDSPKTRNDILLETLSPMRDRIQ